MNQCCGNADCMKSNLELAACIFHSFLWVVSGVRRLHSPAQQHRHSVRTLVVREAHQHDLLPQDQGAVSLETQRPRDAAQQVLHQKGFCRKLRPELSFAFKRKDC